MDRDEEIITHLREVAYLRNEAVRNKDYALIAIPPAIISAMSCVSYFLAFMLAMVTAQRLMPEVSWVYGLLLIVGGWDISQRFIAHLDYAIKLARWARGV